MAELDDALALAALGWRVLPVAIGEKPGGRVTKTPLIRAWQRAASSDPEAVRAMPWEKAGAVGVALPEGVAALDVDDPGAFEEAGLDVPETPGQATRSGGYHRLFATDGREVRQTVREVPGADTRVGPKGFVVAWERWSFGPADLAPAPEWMYAPRRDTAAPEAPAEDFEPIGTRSELIAHAGAWRAAGMTREDVYTILARWRNEGRIADLDTARPWTAQDLKKIAEEAGKWPAGRPLEMPRIKAVRPDEPATSSREQPGGDFVLDAPDEVAAVWGDGDRVLWAVGEALMLAGPPGVGKSTIAQQVVFHGIGLRKGPFLGLTVSLPDGVLGYIAADRAAQVRRSMRRMVSEEDRGVLNERVHVWRGALPFALDDARLKPGRFADWIEERGWSAVLIDSLKDLCSNTTDDEAGLRINRQLQEALNRGIAVFVLHHQRKSSEGNKEPRKLDDVYGSRWLSAGMGSVVMLWGEAGDEVVRLIHLKQPVERVGPMTLRHDHAAGMTIEDGTAAPTIRVKTPKQRLVEALPGTWKELATAINRGERTVKGYLAELKAEGIVTSDQGSSREEAVWRLV